MACKTPGADRLTLLMEYSLPAGQAGGKAASVMDRRLIQQAACRRLERATGGRLTFVGDEIVRVGDGFSRNGVGRAFWPDGGGCDRGDTRAEAR